MAGAVLKSSVNNWAVATAGAHAAATALNNASFLRELICALSLVEMTLTHSHAPPAQRRDTTALSYTLRNVLARDCAPHMQCGTRRRSMLVVIDPQPFGLRFESSGLRDDLIEIDCVVVAGEHLVLT